MPSDADSVQADSQAGELGLVLVGHAALEALELLQAAAADPDYCGPDIRRFERVADDIANVRAGLRDWVITETLRHRPRSRLPAAAVRAALQQAIISRS